MERLPIDDVGGPIFRSNYPAMSRRWCLTNTLSYSTCVALRDWWLGTGWLTPIVITTGGGRNGVRWPDREVLVWNRNYSSVACRANSHEWHDINEYIQGLPAEVRADMPHAYNQATVNPHYILWRADWYERGGALGREAENIPRYCPVTLELSHHAEAYHNPQSLPGFQPYWRVEAFEFEQDWINLSRQVCRTGGLMWRKPDTGALIPADEIEDYTGPTLCWHAAFGSPCYGPHPGPEAPPPTGFSPAKRRGGKTSGGEGRGGRDMAKRGRKTGGPTGAKKAKTCEIAV
jgi:hypothetical protein